MGQTEALKARADVQATAPEVRQSLHALKSVDERGEQPALTVLHVAATDHPPEIQTQGNKILFRPLFHVALHLRTFE
jgi:hypothetical protein